MLCLVSNIFPVYSVKCYSRHFIFYFCTGSYIQHDLHVTALDQSESPLCESLCKKRLGCVSEFEPAVCFYTHLSHP